MGDLIVLPSPKPFPAREFSVSHSAEILFFTGVRYYRMDDAVEPAKLVAVKIAGKQGAIKRRRSLEARTTSKRLREERLREALA